MTSMPTDPGMKGVFEALRHSWTKPGNLPAIPRIALAGEPNSGKTTIANFLLQSQLLAVDIFPNTLCPTLLRFGDKACLRSHRLDGKVALRPLSDLHRLSREAVGFIEIFLPMGVLRKMEILDLPGFGSRREAEAKSRWLKSADIRLWCTPATQAWKASEQAIWTALGAPSASSFLVLTHKDLLSEQQLGEVAERMARETKPYFSHWCAIATPEAIAARNPRGQIVKNEVWTSTGVEDFMKKLMDLLQGAMTQRKNAPQPVYDTLSGQAGLTHPVASFLQLRTRILSKLARRNTPEEAARLMAAEFAIYARDVLRPWLASQTNQPLRLEIAEKLIPGSDAEIVGYLVPTLAGAPVITAEDILNQIGAELNEAFQQPGGEGLSA